MTTKLRSCLGSLALARPQLDRTKVSISYDKFA